MKKLTFLTLAIAVLAFIAPEVFAVDKTIGQGALSLLDEGILRGNWGTIIGLLIAVFGLWMWLVKQETWGVVIIIGGVLITFFPGVFDTLATGARSVFGEFDSGTTIKAGTSAQTGS